MFWRRQICGVAQPIRWLCRAPKPHPPSPCRPCSCCSLQLDNILLHGDAPAILKLCDFGYSKDGETESDCKTACGTPEYMAPEVNIVVGMTLVV